jgi:Rps23 Pro-64 3,4-dihydroxylase Tpa1-like proline 4-hydroxylase
MIAESIMSEEMHAIMPKNNRIVFLNNQKKLPHCVTPVTKYAKKDRFVIASFIGCTKSF